MGALAVKNRGNDNEKCGNPALARPGCSPETVTIIKFKQILLVFGHLLP